MGFQADRIDLPQETFHQRCKAIHPQLEGVTSNLLANFKKGSKQTILWYAHIDTVPDLVKFIAILATEAA